MSNKKTCSNCEFFNSFGHAGHCKRNAPIAIPDNPKEPWSTIAVWPEVSYGNSCGEFKQAKPMITYFLSRHERTQILDLLNKGSYNEVKEMMDNVLEHKRLHDRIFEIDSQWRKWTMTKMEDEKEAIEAGTMEEPTNE